MVSSFGTNVIRSRCLRKAFGAGRLRIAIGAKSMPPGGTLPAPILICAPQHDLAPSPNSPPVAEGGVPQSMPAGSIEFSQPARALG